MCPKTLFPKVWPWFLTTSWAVIMLPPRELVRGSMELAESLAVGQQHLRKVQSPLCMVIPGKSNSTYASYILEWNIFSPISSQLGLLIRNTSLTKSQQHSHYAGSDSRRLSLAKGSGLGWNHLQKNPQKNPMGFCKRKLPKVSLHLSDISRWISEVSAYRFFFVFLRANATQSHHNPTQKLFEGSQ